MAVLGVNKAMNPNLARPNNGRPKGSRNRIERKTELERMFEEKGFDLNEEIVNLVMEKIRDKTITVAEMTKLAPYVTTRKPEMVEATITHDEIPPIVIKDPNDKREDNGDK